MLLLYLSLRKFQGFHNLCARNEGQRPTMYFLLYHNNMVTYDSGLTNHCTPTSPESVIGSGMGKGLNLDQSESSLEVFSRAPTLVGGESESAGGHFSHLTEKVYLRREKNRVLMTLSRPLHSPGHKGS